MHRPVLLYISAAPDLNRERDLLARAVTEIPVDLNWRITQSPRKSEPLDLAAAREAHVHLVLMGGDIRAPVGLEWRIARQAGGRPIPFLKADVTRTLAGMDFVRHVELTTPWRRFVTAAELRRQVLTLLADHLLDAAAFYVLTPAEIHGLQKWREKLEQSEEAPPAEVRGGAGESSVIISRERFEPSEGQVVQPRRPDQPG